MEGGNRGLFEGTTPAPRYVTGFNSRETDEKVTFQFPTTVSHCVNLF
jgi:hypothetical protein